MKKGRLFFIFLCIAIVVVVFTINPLAIALSNSISLVHKNGYFIPKESSIYKFQETKPDKGNGEYWLYGEDDAFYFYNGKCKENPYSFIKKEDAKTNTNFNKYDYTAWQYCYLPTYQEGMQGEVLACGDLLANFGFNKPKHLEFVGCERNPKVQYITRAEYRVSGKHSKKVEDYFIKYFKMPALKIFPHTGWEPDGYGSLKIKSLSSINPNYELMVEMWGYARKEDPNDFTLLPREEVPYFTIYISIVDI